jgi:hypothetical protein
LEGEDDIYYGRTTLCKEVGKINGKLQQFGGIFYLVYSFLDEEQVDVIIGVPCNQ